MKKITWLLLLVFVTMSVCAQKKSDRKTLNNLQSHITYLSSSKLDGRSTGTPGEQLAADYIVAQLEQAGVAPGGDKGFRQEFVIKEGRMPGPECRLNINGKQLQAGKDFIPLPFSGSRAAKGEVMPDVNEPDNIWLVNVDELELKPGYKNMPDEYRKQTQVAAQSGATGIVFFNGKEKEELVTQWMDASQKALGIPAVWVNNAVSRELGDENANGFQISMQVEFRPVKITGTNVIGYIDNKAANTVIIGAHYDHQPHGSRTCTGANDNASGTAAMLEVGRLLKGSALHHYNYLLIAFSGQAYQLAGADYFIRQDARLPAVNYMINMDMIGKWDRDRGLQVGGTGSSPVWENVLREATPRDIKLTTDASGAWISDHTPFFKKNIPVLVFYAGTHNDNAPDSMDNISYDAALQVVKLVYEVISKTDSMEKLMFTGNMKQSSTAGTR